VDKEEEEKSLSEGLLPTVTDEEIKIYDSEKMRALKVEENIFLSDK